MIRVLVVHDTWLMRAALTALLRTDEDFDVEAAPWRKASVRAQRVLPDVCVVDGDSPCCSQLTSQSAGLGSALLVLVTARRPGVLHWAVGERALGFVDKDASPGSLVRAIKQVAAGERYVDDSLAADFLEAARLPLTPRELSVLSLAAEGSSIHEIARALDLSNGTVRNYMAAITRKTGARNRVDAIRISRRAGWL